MPGPCAEGLCGSSRHVISLHHVKQQAMLAHLPRVVKGAHPIRKEKMRAERKALAKRLKGERPDDAADKFRRAEVGRAGTTGKKKAKAK